VRAPKWVRDQVADMLGKRPASGDIAVAVLLMALSIIVTAILAGSIIALVVMMVAGMGWWFGVMVAAIGFAIWVAWRIVLDVANERRGAQ
jgi:hypothetical protein